MENNIGSQITYAAAGATTFLGLTVDAWGIIGVVVGIVVTIITFLVNLYFKNQHLELAKNEKST